MADPDLGAAPASLSDGGEPLQSWFRVAVRLVSGEEEQHTFRARWKALDETRTSGELRKVPRSGVQGEQPGRVLVSWRRSGYTPAGVVGKVPIIGGFLEEIAEAVEEQAGIHDPYTELAGIELEATLNGRIFRIRPERVDGNALYWVFRGRPGDWWTKAKVDRDGVPTPDVIRRQRDLSWRPGAGPLNRVFERHTF